MRLITSYTHLKPAYDSGEKCMVKGIDFDTKYVRDFEILNIVKINNPQLFNVGTSSFGCKMHPDQKLLLNPLCYPLADVPVHTLKSILMRELKHNTQIAVAPRSLLANNPHGSGVIEAGYVITWSGVTFLIPKPGADHYIIELAEGNTYILNSIVHLL